MNGRLFILLLVISGCSSAQKAAAPQAPAAASCPDCPEAGKFSVTFENNAPKFYVQGIVNDQPKKFFVDTGAYRSNIAIDDQTRSIPAAGTTQFASFAMKPMTCGWIRIQSFQVVGTSRVNAKGGPILRCDGTPPMDSILGLDYLDGYTVSLKAQTSMPSGVQTTEMRRDADRHLIIPIQLAGHRQWAGFDTGASFTIVDQRLLSKYPEAFQELRGEHEGKPMKIDFPIAFTEGTGNQFMGKLYTTDRLQVGGGQKLPNQLVIVTPFPKEFRKRLTASIILGAASMLSTNWIFDLYRNVWASTPSHPGSTPRFSVSAEQASHQGKLLVLDGNAKLLDQDWKRTK
jgi:hypothetical protein